jgi:hypothetical protein
MPSASEFFDQLKATNEKLTALITVTSGVRDGVVAMGAGINQLVAQQSFANGVLVHEVRQNETIICLLKQIADNTCRLLNESHVQTGLQQTIATDADTLAALYSVTHAEAALVRERELALKKEIEACCPPRQPEPACRLKECPDPGPLDGGVVLRRGDDVPAVRKDY